MSSSVDRSALAVGACAWQVAVGLALSITVTNDLVAQKLSPALVAARTDLADRQEESVRRGARTCLEANSVDSVELLLEVMDREGRLSRNHFEAGHYRDIVFDVLVQFTDPYARRRVAEEIRSNKQRPFARQWAAEALGHFGGHEFGEHLVKALSDRDDGVVRWAAWSLGKIRYPAAVKELESLQKHKQDYVRANAIEALARIDAARFGPVLVAAARADASGGVRCALLGALPDLAAKDAPALSIEAPSVAALGDADWRPRLQAVENLSAVRSKTAVDALIGALVDGRSVVARRAMEGLQKLTGQPISQVEVWSKWWADHRENFVFPEDGGAVAEREAHTVTFEGIPFDSDCFAFVIDKSYWMQQASKSKGASRDQAARDELQQALDQLRGEPRLNVYLYNEEITPMAKKPVELQKRVLGKIMDFAAEASSGRSKDMWQVLERVVSEPDIDTIYLISSGEADVGLYCHGNRIGRHLRDLNRFYKTTVHAIAYTDHEGDRWHVERVAEATGGMFRAVN